MRIITTISKLGSLRCRRIKPATYRGNKSEDMADQTEQGLGSNLNSTPSLRHITNGSIHETHSNAVLRSSMQKPRTRERALHEGHTDNLLNPEWIIEMKMEAARLFGF